MLFSRPAPDGPAPSRTAGSPGGFYWPLVAVVCPVISVALICVVSTAVLPHPYHRLVNYVFGTALYLAEWVGLGTLLRRRGAYTHTRFAATLVLLLAMSVLMFLLYVGFDQALNPDPT